MARPWEYPRWRRVLMQVVMWVILGGTLGLAQLVVRQRQQAPIFLQLPVQVGPLWVSLPLGWTAILADAPATGELQAVDADQTQELIIRVQRIAAGQEPGSDANQPGAGTQPIYFKGLNRKGVMAGIAEKVQTPDGIVGTEDILVAFTDLPSGYAVEIQFRHGSGKMGAADRRLIQAVADAMTWAGVPSRPAVRRLPSPPTGGGPIRLY